SSWRRSQSALEQQATKFVLRPVLDSGGGRVRRQMPIPIAHQIARLLSTLRGILYMVEGVHEAFRAKAIKRRVDVGLQRQHVGGRKFPARLEHAVNSVGAPRRIPFRADAVGI